MVSMKALRLSDLFGLRLIVVAIFSTGFLCLSKGSINDGISNSCHSTHFVSDSLCCEQHINGSQWMKFLSDTLPMCKLSIAGTHDSGAIRGGRKLKTQSCGIDDQLMLGIRAFDIRLAKKNNQLGLFHSHAFQGVYWENDVLPILISFLKANPSEALIVSLKKEGCVLDDYASLMSACLRTPEYQQYFVAHYRPDLTLKECRGKILFLHRDPAMEDYPGAACIGWDDNSSCMLTLRSNSGHEGFVFLQDEYQYVSGKEGKKKIDACILNFNRINAEPFSSQIGGISFVSATALPRGTPKDFANAVNMPVAEYIARMRLRHCGIVFIDFIEDAGGKELVNCLIRSNSF